MFYADMLFYDKYSDGYSNRRVNFIHFLGDKNNFTHIQTNRKNHKMLYYYKLTKYILLARLFLNKKI